MRALVVDDDPSVREMLAMLLTLEGYEVVTAPDGEGALVAATTHHPDVVVLDVMMPGLDGPSVATRLRADHALAGIPIVFCTAVTDAEEILGDCLTAIDTYVGKPFDTDRLLEAVLAATKGLAADR